MAYGLVNQLFPEAVFAGRRRLLVIKLFFELGRHRLVDQILVGILKLLELVGLVLLCTILASIFSTLLLSLSTPAFWILTRLRIVLGLSVTLPQKLVKS